MRYLSRILESNIICLAKDYPIVTIIGPRQSGKTTLVRHVFSNKPYVSLENPDDREFAQLDPRAFLAKFPDGAILDEIQRLPALLSYIQGIVDDSPKKGLFILTGSHQYQLHESISQSLAGRTAIIKLLPLAFNELPSRQQALDLDSLIFNGMYPRVIVDDLQPTRFYQGYMQTYVERDVRLMVNIKDLSLFQRFIKLCASRVGQLFNASSISNELGITAKTVENWISILEASHVMFRLQPYFENFGKRIIKSPKIYFTDVGLAAYCLDIHDKKQLERDPLRGNLVENYIISEILKLQLNNAIDPSLYFYRDSNQKEVDLIIKQGSQLIPIEIKSSSTFNKTFLKGLDYFKAITKERTSSGYVIYSGQQEQQLKQWQVINFKHLDKYF